MRAPGAVPATPFPLSVAAAATPATRVPFAVLGRVVAVEDVATGDELGRQVLVGEVHAGVDDGDDDALPGARRPCLLGADAVERPLVGGEGVGGGGAGVGGRGGTCGEDGEHAHEEHGGQGRATHALIVASARPDAVAAASEPAQDRDDLAEQADV